ncbi:MAG: hypothetical protein Q7T03_10970, partial [Deltaproteobacteria bacterium]|nr:hypothetical protein [Deltaproteobacteria bacterium]
GMLPTPLMGPLMSLPHGKGERQLRLAAVASASRMEGWGMSVQDGTMGGLPLVASSFVPYAVHLDRSRGAAMIVPVIPNDEETEAFGYARAIQNLIDNPDRAADMAAKSREAAREYEWASLTGRFAAQLGSLLSIQDNVIPGRSVSPRVHVVVLQANPSETDSDSPVLENALKKFGPRNVWVAASPESVEAVTARFPDLLQRNIFGIPIRKGTAAAVATAMYRISKQDPRGVALTLPAEYKGDSHFLFSEALRLASDTLANGGLMVFGADEERAIADDNQEVNPYLWGVRSFLRHFSTFQPVRHAALEAVYGRLSTDKPVPKEAIGRYFMPLRHASIRKALISPAQKSGLVTFSPLPG